MTPQDSWTTRLAEYIANVLPWAHGHQLKGITTFVSMIIEKQTGIQAALARGLGNQEAAVKRLSRLLHNERLAPHRLADAVLAQALGQLPPKGKVRLAIDWTIEGAQHLLVVSLVTGGRAVPIYWRAYDLMSGHIHSGASSHECELVRALAYATPRLLDYSPQGVYRECAPLGTWPPTQRDHHFRGRDH